MEEQKLKELIEKAINKGWVFYGEFSTDVATESVLKLLKEQLHIPVVVRPEILDNYESGCLEHKQQKETITGKKQFYCLDEVHRGKDDICQRQCEYCRKNH